MDEEGGAQSALLLQCVDSTAADLDWLDRHRVSLPDLPGAEPSGAGDVAALYAREPNLIGSMRRVRNPRPGGPAGGGGGRAWGNSSESWTISSLVGKVRGKAPSELGKVALSQEGPGYQRQKAGQIVPVPASQRQSRAGSHTAILSNDQ